MRRSLLLALCLFIFSFFSAARIAYCDDAPDYIDLLKEGFSSYVFPPPGFIVETPSGGPEWRVGEDLYAGVCDEISGRYAAIFEKELAFTDTRLITPKIEPTNPKCWPFIHLLFYLCQNPVYEDRNCRLSLELSTDYGKNSPPSWDTIEEWPDCETPEECAKDWATGEIYWVINEKIQSMEPPTSFHLAFRYHGEQCSGVAIDNIMLGCAPDGDYDDTTGDGSGGDADDDDDGCGCAASRGNPALPLFLFMMLIGLVFGSRCFRTKYTLS
jgi:hypothetical protein